MTAIANQVLHERKVGILPHTPGGRSSLEIDRDGVLLKLMVRLRYTITNGAGGAPTGLKDFWPARLLRRLEVIAGGRDTVWSIAGEDLAERVYYESGLLPYGMSVALTAGAGGVTTVDVVLPLEFTLPNGKREDDTGLDTRGLGQLTLYATWAANASDLFGTTNDAVISAVTCSVEGSYMLNVPQGRVYLVRALDTTTRQLTGTSNNWDVIVDRGTGLVYRSFMVYGRVADIGNNAILNPGSIRVESGSFVFQNREAVQVQADNLHDQRLQDGVKAGAYFLDFTFDGQLVNAINTGSLTSDLKLIFDPTLVAGGDNFITVQREAVRPLKLM